MTTEKIQVLDYKFSTISSALSQLKVDSLYSIQEIGSLISNIENFKKKTNIPQNANQLHGTTNQGILDIKDLYVDMTYQRVIRLQELINKIKEIGFDEFAAGVIDVAERPDGTKVVWDGFRRTLMAFLCGASRVKVSLYNHSDNLTDELCRKDEAKLFRKRNTQEKMKPEEVFRAEVVYDDAVACATLDFLIRCNLDVAGLNPKGKTIGGISEIRSNFKSWSKNVDEDTDPDGPYDWDENMWIEASNIIQTIWKDPKKDLTVSVYLLSNLAWVKTVMLSCDKTYSDEEIIKAIQTWQTKKGKKHQRDITSAGFKNKRIVSCYIAKEILNDDNGLYDKLINHMDKEQQALFTTIG